MKFLIKNKVDYVTYNTLYYEITNEPGSFYTEYRTIDQELVFGYLSICFMDRFLLSVTGYCPLTRFDEGYEQLSYDTIDGCVYLEMENYGYQPSKKIIDYSELTFVKNTKLNKFYIHISALQNIEKSKFVKLSESIVVIMKDSEILGFVLSPKIV